MTYDLGSFQYAFSTMAQTVGAGFAFLIAVVTPQIQGKLGTFANRARDVRDSLRPSPVLTTFLNLALSGEDWNEWVPLARYVGWHAACSGEKKDHAERVLKGLERDLDFVDFVRDKTKRALQETVVVIVLCFVLLPLLTKHVIIYNGLYLLTWFLLILTTGLAVKSVLSFLQILMAAFSPDTATIPPVQRPLPIPNVYMCDVKVKQIKDTDMNIIRKILQSYHAYIDECRFNSADNSLDLSPFDVRIEHQTQAWRETFVDEIKRAAPTAQVRIATYRLVDGKQQGVQVTFRPS